MKYPCHCHALRARNDTCVTGVRQFLPETREFLLNVKERIAFF